MKALVALVLLFAVLGCEREVIGGELRARNALLQHLNDTGFLHRYKSEIGRFKEVEGGDLLGIVKVGGLRRSNETAKEWGGEIVGPMFYKIYVFKVGDGTITSVIRHPNAKEMIESFEGEVIPPPKTQSPNEVIVPHSLLPSSLRP
ncbi:MAG: hypothetical protein AAF514_13005 [Verrucomicrobiota bacterium]